MNKFLVFVSLTTFLSGCVSGGFRITEKAKEEFIFEGKVLDGETGQPINDLNVEIYSWYQPVFTMISYRKLGDVRTDKFGEFIFPTQELELIIGIEGCGYFNHYGSQPFDPRIAQTFMIKNRPDFLFNVIEIQESNKSGVSTPRSRDAAPLR